MMRVAGNCRRRTEHNCPDGMSEAEAPQGGQDNKKVTLKHGEIKNLDMPGMTIDRVKAATR